MIARLAAVRVGGVVAVSHVVIGLIGEFETHSTSFAFIGPDPMIQGIHVLLAGMPSDEAAVARVTLVSHHLRLCSANRYERILVILK